jgi:hypothetical protein
MIKKRIEIKHNHTLTPLKRKHYKDYGYLWHFTIEEQLDYGPSVIAKFAYQVSVHLVYGNTSAQLVLYVLVVLCELASSQLS